MVVVEVNGYTIEPGADLRRANLRGADLRKANLTEANLYEANLTGANLEEANLTGANLRGADFDNANLFKANLSGAIFDGGTEFIEANLEEANLSGTDFSEAGVYGHATGANLRGVSLNGANLSPSDGSVRRLFGLDLSYADLRGANLRLVEFVETNLSGAIANEDTIWPDWFDPKAAGVIFE